MDCGQDYGNNLKENPTRCGNILVLELVTRTKCPVKRLSFLEQSAWAGMALFNKIELSQQHVLKKTRLWPTHQRLNVGHPDGFVDWLIGFIEGDGTFHFRQNKNGSWDFCLTIPAANYNKKLLAYVKKKLNCGTITIAGKNINQFRVRNFDVLYYFLIPLLKTGPFITNLKAYQFIQFQKALQLFNLWKEQKLLKSTRDILLNELKCEIYDPNKRYALWRMQKSVNPHLVPSKGWILGFTEAEGSFYLVKKSLNQIVHGAGWVQKEEIRLLELMRQRWKINANVKQHSLKNCYMLDTTASSAIETLIPFFEGKLKGMKAVEFSKWARSYRKYKGNYEKLEKLQNQMRKAKKLESLFLG
jgi:hypothetical protein